MEGQTNFKCPCLIIPTIKQQQKQKKTENLLNTLFFSILRKLRQTKYKLCFRVINLVNNGRIVPRTPLLLNGLEMAGGVGGTVFDHLQ